MFYTNVSINKHMFYTCARFFKCYTQKVSFNAIVSFKTHSVIIQRLERFSWNFSTVLTDDN